MAKTTLTLPKPDVTPGYPVASVVWERMSGQFFLDGLRVGTSAVPPGLHVVATPIGNLGDITLRALETLAGVDLILAEDTRVTRVLLRHFGIETPLAACHEHNSAEMAPKIVSRLAEGGRIALVSDAGTPLVSDPGQRIVDAAIAAGHPVIANPGASAILAALVCAGLPAERFFFEGFLPTKSGERRRRLRALESIPATLVFYEAPHRVAETLADLAAVLGERRGVLARELTKKFETIRRDTLPALAAALAGEPTPKGEIVLLVAAPEGAAALDDAGIDRALRAALAQHSQRDAVQLVAAELGLPRKRVYARALRLGDGDG